MVGGAITHSILLTNLDEHPYANFEQNNAHPKIAHKVINFLLKAGAK